MEFEVEDVLREYQMIEEELNQDSDEDEDLQGVPKDLRSISHNIARNASANFGATRGDLSHSGLLSQYVSQKMAK